MSDFNDNAIMFSGRKVRSHGSTTSRSSTRFVGSKRCRGEFDEVIPSIEEHDTPPLLGSAENPFSISSDSESSGSDIDVGTSSPKRRRIGIVSLSPPKYSPITPLRQSFWNSVTDSRRRVRGPTSESGVQDDNNDANEIIRMMRIMRMRMILRMMKMIRMVRIRRIRFA